MVSYIVNYCKFSLEILFSFTNKLISCCFDKTDLDFYSYDYFLAPNL